MKFVFAYETLLHHRARAEDEARREYLQAKSELDLCLKAIETLYKKMDESRREISLLQKLGNQSLEPIRMREGFIENTKIKVTAERARAREIMQTVESKQTALVEAAKEHKILLKLKEKRRKEFSHLQKKLEAKRMEDLTTMRAPRRSV